MAMRPSGSNWISLILALAFLLGPGRLFPVLAESPSEGTLGEGLSLFQQGEYAQAEKVFQRLEEKAGDPRLAADLIFLQGQAHRKLENWPRAALAFSRAAEVHPLLADYALFFQAEALEKTGEGEKNLEVLLRLVSLHPQSLLVPQARLKAAEIHFQGGDYRMAAEVCEALLQAPPWKDVHARARFLLGQAEEGLSRWTEAVRAYRELWLKHPLHESAPKARSRWESLVKEKKAPEEKISPEALFNRALHFYQGHSYETALKEMNRIEGYPAGSYPPDYSGQDWVDDLYFHRGMGHYRLKQYSRAIEVFDLVVRRSGNEAMAEKSLFWMLQTQVRSGRKEAALHTCSLLQASYPRSPFLAQALSLKAAVLDDQGKTEQAVSLYLEVAEKFPQSSLRFAALWNAGWLLYRKDDWAGALQAWDRLQAMEPPARWMEKVLYWRGKTLEKTGRDREAKENDARLLRVFPTSFYSQLVSAGGRAPQAEKGPFPPLREPSLPPFLEVKASSGGSRILHLEKGRLLARLALPALATEELEAAEREGVNLEEMWMEISRLYREAEEYYRSNLLVRRKFTLKPLNSRSSERDRVLHLLAYPLGNSLPVSQQAEARDLDPALLSALILEESRFHVQAVSPAGARGLMQVMPATGRQIAKELKMRRFSEGQLLDPGVNIRLGTWYFAKMLEEFGGKIHLALAAYNAGPGAVRRWLANAASEGEDEFVEKIPYTETRNYVIRVMGSAQVYRFLYRTPQEKPPPP